MYAKVDLKSYDRKRPPYAIKGDVVEVLETQPTVCICMNKKGDKFPTNSNNLSESYVPRDLTKTELKVKERLSKVLALSKDGQSFIKLVNKVKTGEIKKFDLADSKEQWLDIARAVWTERFGITKK